MLLQNSQPQLSFTTTDSFEQTITLDDETILFELNNALSLLDSQYEYIDSLSTVADNPSGEWAEYIYKLLKLYAGSAKITSKIGLALAKYILANHEYSFEYTREALDNLDVLDADLDSGLDNGKISAVAYGNIRDYNNDIRAGLELIAGKSGF